MAEASQDIDLDSVIDRLLEGEPLHQLGRGNRVAGANSAGMESCEAASEDCSISQYAAQCSAVIALSSL